MAAGEITQRSGASFELDALEARYGQLVVRGRWHGVRGLRFVRPTLLVGDRTVLASLDHKPWPSDATPWTAAFPWTDDVPDAADVRLSVAPSVTVPLDGSAAPGPAAVAGVEREEALQQADAARRARDAALRERDHALGQRDEAVGERDAALRTRGRMEEERDRAQAALERAEAERDEARRLLDESRRELAAAVSERNRASREAADATSEAADALAERERLAAQRDDALLAHETLERTVRSTAAAATPAPEPPARAPDDETRPLGVRRIPAGRLLGASLKADETRPVTNYDVWALRALGGTAAVLFTLLLIMMLRAFL